MSFSPQRRMKDEEEENHDCCWFEAKYVERTSCHGLGCIFSHESYFAKAVWLFIVTVFSAAMFYQAFLNLTEFLQFDTSTSVEREYSTDIEFPAVTICNFNRFFKDFYKNDISEDELDFNFYLNRVNSPRWHDDEWTTNYTWENEVEKNLSTLVYSDYLREKGWNIGIALYDCFFGDEHCHYDNFTTIQTEMGQCFVFNGDEHSKIKQNSPGTINGLRVWFDSQHWEYTEEEFAGIEDAGIKFLVHDPHITPNVLQYGYTVPPGSKAIAAVKKRRYDLVEEPYGQCIRKTKKLKYFPKYTMDGCLTECHTDLVIEECGCHTFYQGWADYFAEECTILELLNCATPALAEIRKTYSMEECNCSIPCSLEEFEVSVTYGLYPGYQIVQKYKDQYPDDLETAGYVGANYISLDIGFNIIGYENSIQSISYTWQSLFSNFGGSFGLWTGVSIFTIVEFVYFFLKRIRFCLSSENIATRKKQSKGESKYDNNAFCHDVTLAEQPKAYD